MASWVEWVRSLPAGLSHFRGREQEEATPVPADGAVKNLNLSIHYVSHQQPSVREHLQNWRDQITKQARLLLLLDGEGRVKEEEEACSSSSVVEAHLRMATASGPGWKGWVFGCRELVLGWLVCHAAGTSGDQQERVCLRLCNYATRLGPHILTLGHSTKRDDEGQAGFFGEGVKVEINRLVASGVDVRYWTAGCRWEFFHATNAEATSSNPVQELAVRFHHQNGHSGSSVSPVGPLHTLVELLGLPSSSFNPLHFLFLASSPPSSPSSSSSTRDSPTATPLQCRGYRGLNLLLDSTFHGQVFVHGIFVQEETASLHGLGLNLVASGLPFKLGRDRDSLDVQGLVGHLLCSLFAPESFRLNPPEVMEAALAAVYDFLNHKEASSRFRYCFATARATTTSQRDQRAMARYLLQRFLSLHGENAVPTSPENSNTNENRKDEARMLGAQLVPLSDLLFAFLYELCPDECPTLDRFWQRHSKAILALPEYIDPTTEAPPPYTCPLIPLEAGGALAALAASIKGMVTELFAPVHITGYQVRFKEFPTEAQNGRRLTPLKVVLEKEQKECTFYIIDDRCMGPDSVHKKLQEEDPGFHCSGTNCGCLRDVLVDELLQTLDMSARKSVERFIRRRTFGRIYKDDMPSSPINKLTEHHPSLASSSSSAGGSSSFFSPPSPSSPRSPSSILAATPFDDGGDGRTSPQHIHDSNLPQEEGGGGRGLADSALEYMQRDLRECLSATASASGGASTSRLLLREPRKEEVESHCGGSRQDERDLSTLLKTDLRILGCPLYVEKPQTSELSSLHPLQAMLFDQNLISTNRHNALKASRELWLFAGMLRDLAQHVLGLPSSVLLSILWEDSRCVAFNLGHNLFFNLRYFEGLLSSKTKPPQAREEPPASPTQMLSFWFTTFCHELAHNKAKGHDRRHESVMEHLIAQALPALTAFISDNAAALAGWESYGRRLSRKYPM
ncbi:Mg2+ and Co2+ transporter CorB [Balamuthia mandrillaris]